MQTAINSPGSFLASFFSSDGIEPGLKLITGPRGAGKTQTCLELSRHARSLGLHVGGLVSPAVFENGKKTGIDLIELSMGERRPLAYLRGNAQGDIRTSDWQLLAQTLEWGNSVLERSANYQVLILDELGPLEFEHGVGFVAAFDLIEAKRDLPVFVTIRPSLLAAAQSRWSWAQVFDISHGVVS